MDPSHVHVDLVTKRIEVRDENADPCEVYSQVKEKWAHEFPWRYRLTDDGVVRELVNGWTSNIDLTIVEGRSQ